MVLLEQFPFVIDYGGRRSGLDRRVFSYTAHIPERRSGQDRRSGKDRRSRQDRRTLMDPTISMDRRSGRDRRGAFAWWVIRKYKRVFFLLPLFRSDARISEDRSKLPQVFCDAMNKSLSAFWVFEVTNNPLLPKSAFTKSKKKLGQPFYCCQDFQRCHFSRIRIHPFF